MLFAFFVSNFNNLLRDQKLLPRQVENAQVPNERRPNENIVGRRAEFPHPLRKRKPSRRESSGDSVFREALHRVWASVLPAAPESGFGAGFNEGLRILLTVFGVRYCFVLRSWSPWRESNSRSRPYQGRALPLSHTGGLSVSLRPLAFAAFSAGHRKTEETSTRKLERETGLEPATLSLEG